MLSKEQEEKRIKLTRICVNALLGEKLNEQEISEKYKIPQSTIDRYLNKNQLYYHYKSFYKNHSMNKSFYKKECVCSKI